MPVLKCCRKGLSNNWMNLIPKTIAENENADIFGPIWWHTHKNERAFTIVFCGGKGMGKSTAMNSVGLLLDRTKEEDVTRYDLTHICYKPQQFTKWARKTDMPLGTVISMDDAGLALYNKEGMSKMSINIGKALQIIRVKGIIILMSLPFFHILESHARIHVNLYVEIREKRIHQQINVARLMELLPDHRTGKIYYQNIFKEKQVQHGKYTRFTVPVDLGNEYIFHRPDIKFCHAYEASDTEQKNAVLDYIDLDCQRIENQQYESIRRANRLSYNEALALVRSEFRKYMNEKGRIDKSQIMALCVDQQGNNYFGVDYAKLITKRLNTEMQKGMLR